MIKKQNIDNLINHFSPSYNEVSVSHENMSNESIKVTFSADVIRVRGITSGLLTLDLKARIIFGKKRMKHFKPIVKYLRTKSVMPTAQIRSKKSKLLRLGLANMRLEEKKQDGAVTGRSDVFTWIGRATSNRKTNV